jgi:hypothetical protein
VLILVAAPLILFNLVLFGLIFGAPEVMFAAGHGNVVTIPRAEAMATVL